MAQHQPATAVRFYTARPPSQARFARAGAGWEGWTGYRQSRLPAQSVAAARVARVSRVCGIRCVPVSRGGFRVPFGDSGCVSKLGQIQVNGDRFNWGSPRFNLLLALLPFRTRVFIVFSVIYSIREAIVLISMMWAMVIITLIMILGFSVATHNHQ